MRGFSAVARQRTVTGVVTTMSHHSANVLCAFVNYNPTVTTTEGCEKKVIQHVPHFDILSSAVQYLLQRKIPEKNKSTLANVLSTCSVTYCSHESVHLHGIRTARDSWAPNEETTQRPERSAIHFLLIVEVESHSRHVKKYSSCFASSCV